MQFPSQQRALPDSTILIDCLQTERQLAAGFHQGALEAAHPEARDALLNGHRQAVQAAARLLDLGRRRGFSM
ncbi:MAG: spore coat protein [Thermaerobacterales bacterium]